MKDYLCYFLEVKVIAGVVRVQARFPENHAHAGANVFKSTLVNQQETAIFKAMHNIAYADCFATALAKAKKTELGTGHPEIKQVEGEIKVAWLKEAK